MSDARTVLAVAMLMHVTDVRGCWNVQATCVQRCKYVFGAVCWLGSLEVERQRGSQSELIDTQDSSCRSTCALNVINEEVIARGGI